MITYAAVILFGLIAGSFISLVSYRLPHHEDIIIKRSKCPKCNHVLGVMDLLPIISWVLGKGRCRYCRAPISLRYPLIEGTTASLFCLNYVTSGDLHATIILCAITVALLILIITDFEHYIIPDSIQVTLAILALFFIHYIGFSYFTMVGMALAAFTLGLVLHYGCKWILKKDGLGWGDVKLLGVSGLMIPLNIYPLYLLISGILGILIGITWRFIGKGPFYPFGPALAVALYLCLLFLVAP